jgi:NhaC family Na+:H+ antiporter
VPTVSYLPYCFFNLLSPVINVLFGYIGFKTPAARPEEPAAQEAPVTAQEQASP